MRASSLLKVRKIATDGQGNYEVPALKEGTYRLKAAKSGFKTFVATDIFLASDQVKRVDVELQVGTTTTEVKVSAAANVIQVESGKLDSQFSADNTVLLPRRCR